MSTESRLGFTPEELRELRQAFLDEAREQLDQLDAAFAALEEAPDGESFSALLRGLHTLKGAAGAVELDELAHHAHRLEDLVVAMRRAGTPAREALASLGSGIEHLRRLAFVPTAAVAAPSVVVIARPSPSSLPEQAPPTAALERRADDRRVAGEPGFLRVEVERIDELLDGAGELVIDRTRIARRMQELVACVRDVAQVRGSLRAGLAEARSRGADLAHRVAEVDSELSVALANLERAVAGMNEDTDGLHRTSQGLQDGLQRLRMMKVGRLFARLERALGDLARRAGKEVTLATSGADTEIDKAVVERIADPLLQLVRNAVAHGIESPDARARAGKPPVGTVRLAAEQRGHQIVLSVMDDGAGVDREAVRAALVRGGLSVEAAANLEDRELLDAIFGGGVTTRTAVDDLAGRGVGLEAVRSAIAGLGGEVSCESPVGGGTRFTVRLPLTTAIAQALLFKVGGNVYAVPAASVLMTVPTAASDVTRGPSGDWLTVRDEDLPLVRLGALFDAPAPPGPVRRWAIVAEHDGERFAMTCDKVIGPREIVVRSLGPLLAPLKLFAGATISGAGKVQLILDVGTLAAHARGEGRIGARPTGSAERRILLADDSRSQRESAALVLQQGGYRVDTVPDGWDAWELLQDQRYDLLITDIEMPRLDGCELTTKVRRHPDLRQMGVLVMTSRSGDVVRQRALAAGADAFLAKPLHRRAFLDAVEAAMGARRPL